MRSAACGFRTSQLAKLLRMRTATGQRLLVFVSLLLLLLLLLSPPPGALAFVASLDSDFTFTLPAGRKECFFQTMKKEATLEIEYQVRKERRWKIGNRRLSGVWENRGSKKKKGGGGSSVCL